VIKFLMLPVGEELLVATMVKLWAELADKLEMTQLTATAVPGVTLVNVQLEGVAVGLVA
jgi:hypothetical protein